MLDKYLLGIDIGSSACKITFLSIKSKKFYTFSNSYKTFYPKPNWAEQDSNDWLISLRNIIKYAFEHIKIDKSQIIAVGLSGVTHSPVLLDDKYNVIDKVIHLTDSRSLKQSQQLEQYNDLFLNKCFNPVSPMWTISMLKWINQEKKDVWKRIKKIIFPKDFIRYKLTGDIYTDEIDAEGTLLFDPIKKKWIDDFAELINLKTCVLPDVLKPTDCVSRISDYGEEWSGILKGTPVMAGTTDTLLEILAAGNIEVGQCTIKLATFGRICVLTEKPYSGKGIITYSYIIPGLWYPGTGTKSCASSFKWIKDEFFKDFLKRRKDNFNDFNIFEKIDEEADEVKIGCDGLIFHPYLLGEGSPYNDSKLRGDFIGITLHHKRKHFARAVLEGTSFSLLDSLEFLKMNGIKINNQLKIIGGGSRSKVWTKILSDVLGYNTAVPLSTDASFGAAMLAGVAVNIFKSIKDAVNHCCDIKIENSYEKENHRIYNKIFQIYKKSKEALTDIYHEISDNI